MPPIPVFHVLLGLCRRHIRMLGHGSPPKWPSMSLLTICFIWQFPDRSLLQLVAWFTRHVNYLYKPNERTTCTEVYVNLILTCSHTSWLNTPLYIKDWHQNYTKHRICVKHEPVKIIIYISSEYLSCPKCSPIITLHILDQTQRWASSSKVVKTSSTEAPLC